MPENDATKACRIFIYFLIVLSASCTTYAPEGDMTGTYKVTERTCKGGEHQREACADIKFIEIVKGKFYKIKDDEYAFVLWSGDSDLDYSARKLNQKIESTSYPAEITIDSNGVYIEKLIFTSRTEGRYVSGKEADLSEFVFKKASKEDLSIYNKHYPGSN